MRNNLPYQYRADPWLLALEQALSAQWARLEAGARELPRQMSLDTVTWNLGVEERIAGLVPSAQASQEERRSALKAQWRIGQKATLAQIQAVAESWPSREVKAAFLGGVIVLDIINLEGQAQDIRSAVERIQPAHLPLVITLRQYVTSGAYVGAIPRQGERLILWKVDCT